MYIKETDYMEMWISDKQSIISIMIQNMNDDINAGYNPTGSIIKRELEEIAAYREKYDTELLALADRKNPNYWCYLDMVRRGAIEA